jgi:lipoprotein NlpI
MGIARNLKHCLAIGVLITALLPPLASAGDATPLLDYALTQTFDPSTRDVAAGQQVKGLQRALERHPPPAENCSRTLGANRFAAMYDDLGAALDSAGDYESAADAYQHALACAPRASHLRAPLATDLLYLERYGDAREVASRDDGSEQPDIELDTVLAELDIIDERWNEAIPRLQRLATDSEDDEFAAYFQCLSWLAQRQSGVAKPALVSRADPDGWPQPLLAAFRGEIDEAEVTKRVDEEKSPDRRREMLTEALYYLGQRRLSEGEQDSGRRYLAAAVNLKVHYFVEHHLAAAALAKLRALNGAQDVSPP